MKKLMNLTVTEPEAPGHVTVAPAGGAMPDTSNVNFYAGDTVRRTGTVIRTPVGKEMIGRVIDPLGAPPLDRWNELNWPSEYPLSYHEMSILLPHFLKEGRGSLEVYFSRVYNPIWTNPDGFSWIEALRDEDKVGCHVALTPTWSETAWFADYVLPMGVGAERHDGTRPPTLENAEDTGAADLGAVVRSRPVRGARRTSHSFADGRSRRTDHPRRGGRTAP